MKGAARNPAIELRLYNGGSFVAPEKYRNDEKAMIASLVKTTLRNVQTQTQFRKSTDGGKPKS